MYSVLMNKAIDEACYMGSLGRRLFIYNNDSVMVSVAENMLIFPNATLMENKSNVTHRLFMNLLLCILESGFTCL